MPDFQQTVGVIGAGTFGTAIANLLSRRVDVLLFSRSPETVERINRERTNFGLKLSPRISAINNVQELAEKCTLIFPVVPSDGFRSTMQRIGPHLRPYHILIHGTKGFDIQGITPEQMDEGLLEPQHVSTMSQVITQETVVRRVGCLSGPNLATEILEGQPTATVIGSVYEEVIELGKKVLSSDAFHVFGNNDILGAELAGALKNVIAIGSGILRGRGLGKNLQAMLITRGLMEMVRFGQAMGTTNSAFYGTAGIGDLVATATSKSSRNYTFGFRLGQGEKMQDIQATMPELAEGVRTLKITWHLANYYKLRLPITQMLYNIVFEGYNIDKAIKYLITYPYDVDVDF